MLSVLCPGNNPCDMAGDQVERSKVRPFSFSAWVLACCWDTCPTYGANL